MKTTRLIGVCAVLTLTQMLTGCGGGGGPVPPPGPVDRIAFQTTCEGGNSIYSMSQNRTHYSRLVSQGFQPALSPFARKLAYVIGSGENAKICVVNTNGSGRAVLSGDSQYCQYPSFSFDGSRIVFVRRTSHGSEISAMYSDGSGPITTLAYSARNSSPSFSSDGSKIVFASSRDNEATDHLAHYDICVMNSDGSDVSVLTSGNATNSLEPSFSPDGSKIAFTSDRDGSKEIYIMNSDGSGQTRLTNTPGGNMQPTFSPDGTKIAFASHRDGNWDIYIMNTDGSNQRRITFDHGDDNYPSFARY